MFIFEMSAGVWVVWRFVRLYGSYVRLRTNVYFCNGGASLADGKFSIRPMFLPRAPLQVLMLDRTSAFHSAVGTWYAGEKEDFLSFLLLFI